LAFALAFGARAGVWRSRSRSALAISMVRSSRGAGDRHGSFCEGGCVVACAGTNRQQTVGENEK
jgi:hypothetical protein